MIRLTKVKQAKEDMKNIESLNAHINIITESDGSTEIIVYENNASKLTTVRSYFESKGYTLTN